VSEVTENLKTHRTSLSNCKMFGAFVPQKGSKCTLQGMINESDHKASGSRELLLCFLAASL
jgi:hypothetical protein